MRFLIVGLGSMGKRRIRNLQYLKAGEVLGFDLRTDRCQEARQKYNIEIFADFDEAMDREPDALIISTPPDKHVNYAMIAAKANIDFFTESNFVLDGMEELIALCKGRNIVAAPSCTLRYHPSVKLMKEMLDKGEIGQVLNFVYRYGEYLPDWHPWENIKDFYVSKRQTGACRDIVAFELDFITSFFGQVRTVSCFKDKLSHLECDIDDVYQINLRFDRGIMGSLLVNVIERIEKEPSRYFKMISEEGLILWDNEQKSVRVYKSSDKMWKEYPEPPQAAPGPSGWGEKSAFNTDMYIAELETFIKAIKGETCYPKTFEEDRQIIEVLYAAERSAETGTHIHLR